MVTPGLGLQLQEENGPEQGIARLGTSRTAFVGRTLRGPVNHPVLLKSFGEFQQVFGGLWQPSTLGYAVEHFFDNGGVEAIIVRVVNGARPATLTLAAADQKLTLKAVRPGTREFLRAGIDYDNIGVDEPGCFNLTLQRVRLQGGSHVEDQEIFPRLSMQPSDERFVAATMAQSELARVDGTLPSSRPDRTLDASGAHGAAYTNSNSDGDDGAPLTDYDLIGSAADHTGLFALDGIDFNFLCMPPLSREQDVGPSGLLVAMRYCKERRALMIIDPPSTWHTAEEALRGMRAWEMPSENALMYFPRILAHDKLRGHFESFAPCGAVAGLLARGDETSPPWAAAKLEDAVLRPGYRPACLVAEDRRARLLQCGVNTLQAVRSVARIGVKPRTLARGTAGGADWQQLGSRRLALFIVNSLERGTRWVLGAAQRAQAADAVEGHARRFLEDLHEAGAFPGRSPAEAFFVVCNRRGGTPGGVHADGFQFLVGFAAERRLEFHCYRITHTVSGSTVQPIGLNRASLADFCPAELEWVDKLAAQLGLP